MRAWICALLGGAARCCSFAFCASGTTDQGGLGVSPPGKGIPAVQIFWRRESAEKCGRKTVLNVCVIRCTDRSWICVLLGAASSCSFAFSASGATAGFGLRFRGSGELGLRVEEGRGAVPSRSAPAAPLLAGDGASTLDREIRPDFPSLPDFVRQNLPGRFSQNETAQKSVSVSLWIVRGAYRSCVCALLGARRCCSFAFSASGATACGGWGVSPPQVNPAGQIFWTREGDEKCGRKP